MHPVLLRIGPLTVYSYGLCVAAAAALSWSLILRRSAQAGLQKTVVSDLIFFVFIFGILGARAWFVAQNWNDYRDEPWRVLFVNEVGLVWYGGFFAAVTAGAIFARRRGLPFLRLCDLFVPVLALAHAVGRLGCFLNGCCSGLATTSRWGVLFPEEALPRWPVQLYESAFLAALGAFLFALSSRRHRTGGILFAYLFYYGLWRFFIENLREGQPTLAFWTPPQWASLAAVAASAVWFWRTRKDGRA